MGRSRAKARRPEGPKNPPLFVDWGFLWRRPSDAVAIHRWNARRVWREHPWLRPKLALLRELVAWPRQAARLSRYYADRYGGAAKRASGKKKHVQRREMRRLALVHFIPPRAYYLFNLHDEANARRAPEYLHRIETKRDGLFRFLRRSAGGDSRSVVDKSLFAETCRVHGLRTPPVLLEIDGGDVAAVTAAPAPGACDLIVKPAIGRGGREIERWDRVDAGYRSPSGETLSEAALLQRLLERSRAGRLIVQQRLTNHPDIEDLGGGILTTARIMTCLDEVGAAEATTAAFRIAVDNTTVDNFHAGGIAAAVDLSTGRLGRAIGLRGKSPWYAAHPLTGSAIEGRRLPFWKEALELVTRAHGAFPGLVLVGWDVGLLEDGPVLIEANTGADVNILQRPHGRPIGGTRLGELLAYHLRRARAARPAAGARSA